MDHIEPIDNDKRLRVEDSVLIEETGKYTCLYCGNTYDSKEAAMPDPHCCELAPDNGFEDDA